MSHRKDLFRFTAQLGVAAVLFAITPGAAVLGTGAIAIAALVGLRLDRKDADLKALTERAQAEAEAALANSPDLTDADFARARTLLESCRVEIDPAAYVLGARAGSPEQRLANDILEGLDFQAGDEAPKAILELTLPVTIRVAAEHPKAHQQIAREFLTQILRDAGHANENTAEILLLVRELHAIKQTTVPEEALIAIARKVQPRVANKDEALRELERATDIAAEQIARGEAGSNLDAFVDDVLRRLGALTTEGKLDEAVDLALAKLAEAKAGVAQVRNAAVNALLLKGDTTGAATLIAERVDEDTPDSAARFDALMEEQGAWGDRGYRQGLWLDSKVSLALARLTVPRASNPAQRGAALSNLGAALAATGERERSRSRMQEAIDAYTAACEEFTREGYDLGWATTQSNIGDALRILGEWETGTTTLREALAASDAALRALTCENFPEGWASAQSGRGKILLLIGQREQDARSLRAAVKAFRRTGRVWSREDESTRWAEMQSNLGYALASLGVLEASTQRLEEALAAYHAALRVLDGDLGRFLRGLVQENVAQAHLALFRFTGDPGQLDAAGSAATEAVEVFRDVGAIANLEKAAALVLTIHMHRSR